MNLPLHGCLLLTGFLFITPVLYYPCLCACLLCFFVCFFCYHTRPCLSKYTHSNDASFCLSSCKHMYISVFTAISTLLSWRSLSFLFYAWLIYIAKRNSNKIQIIKKICCMESTHRGVPRYLTSHWTCEHSQTSRSVTEAQISKDFHHYYNRSILLNVFKLMTLLPLVKGKTK